MSGKNKVIPDTNVILRFLLQDNTTQFKEASRFFAAVHTGETQAIILESVLAECVYVLTKFYKVPKKETTETLTGLLRYKGVINTDKDTMIEALALFAAKNIDLVDCIVIAKGCQQNIEIFSFDQELRKAAAKAGKQ